MAAYNWPVLLPQSPQKGFSESIGLNILRTPMDAGPAKQRRRSSRPSTMSVNFLMTTTQVATLESFIFNTILGTARFNFLHPRTQASVEVRIVPQQDGELFKSQYAAPGYWTVSLNLEIMP